MGTAVLFDIRDPDFDESAVGAAVSFLRWVDATFSTHRDDSQISLLRSGGLTMGDVHPLVRDVLARCEMLRRDTEGAFDHHPDTTLDPSGLVKGWALERAAAILSRTGIESFLVSAGGDIVARGAPEGLAAWRVGIRDPAHPEATLGTVQLRGLAIATSGRYERGNHIWSSGDMGEVLASVSMVGPDLGTADALATAVFASGLADLGWLNRFPGYDLIAVTADRRILRTAGAPFVSASTQ